MTANERWDVKGQIKIICGLFPPFEKFWLCSRVNIMKRKSTNVACVNFQSYSESQQDITCLLLKLAVLGWVPLSAIFNIFFYVSEGSCCLNKPQYIQYMSVTQLKFDKQQIVEVILISSTRDDRLSRGIAEETNVLLMRTVIRYVFIKSASYFYWVRF